MTSLGHSLLGASVGILCVPGLDRLYRRWPILIAIIAVANLPDWPIAGWGHDHLVVSHSILVNGTAILGLAIGLYLHGGAWVRQTHRRVVLGLIAAWLSHFLLDALYADSRLAVFWPVSEATVSLPVPWLTTLPHVPPPFDRPVIRILMLEALTFAPLIVLAVAVRRWKASARTPIDDQGCGT